MIDIVQVNNVTPELMDAMARLVPQLSQKQPPSESELEALVHSVCTSLLAARDAGGMIVGIACITVYRVPTGMRANIEDVVVDRGARGQGIGEALTRRCMDIARSKGSSIVTLSSRPSREAANRLYQRMGFELRDTNSYIYRFS